MSLSFKTILKDMNLDLNRRHVAVIPIRRGVMRLDLLCGYALTFTVRLRAWIYCAATRWVIFISIRRFLRLASSLFPGSSGWNSPYPVAARRFAGTP